jgi:hypothetical protein
VKTGRLSLKISLASTHSKVLLFRTEPYQLDSLVLQ